MTRGRNRVPGVAAEFGEAGPVGNLAVPVIDAFQPVRSRWTWQPLLPELWLHEQERHLFLETIHGPRKKV